MTQNKRVSVKTGNAARTVVQAGPAWIIVEFIDAGIYDMSDRLFGASVLLLMLIGSYVMPIIENNLGRALFRNPYVEDVPVAPEVVKPRS